MVAMISDNNEHMFLEPTGHLICLFKWKTAQTEFKAFSFFILAFRKRAKLDVPFKKVIWANYMFCTAFVTNIDFIGA